MFDSTRPDSFSQSPGNESQLTGTLHSLCQVIAVGPLPSSRVDHAFLQPSYETSFLAMVNRESQALQKHELDAELSQASRRLIEQKCEPVTTL